MHMKLLARNYKAFEAIPTLLEAMPILSMQ